MHGTNFRLRRARFTKIQGWMGGLKLTAPAAEGSEVRRVTAQLHAKLGEQRLHLIDLKDGTADDIVLNAATTSSLLECFAIDFDPNSTKHGATPKNVADM